MSRIAWCQTFGVTTPRLNNDPIAGFEGTLAPESGDVNWVPFITFYGGHVWEEGLPGDVQPTMEFSAVWTPAVADASPVFTEPVLVGGEPNSGFSVYFNANPPMKGVLLISGLADGEPCENQLAVTVTAGGSGYGTVSWEELDGAPAPPSEFWTRFAYSYEVI